MTLAGCITPGHENIYAKRYRSGTLGMTKEQLNEWFYLPTSSPQIIRTDVRQGNALFRTLHLQGYRVIGMSDFVTALNQPDSDLLQIAKSVQADLIVTLSVYAGQHVVNLPYVNTISSGGFYTTNTNATGTGYNSGQFSGDISGTYSGQSQMELSGTITTYTPPVTSTQWIPTNLQYTHLSAVFYRRAKSPSVPEPRI
jgi:hypothetical protein